MACGHRATWAAPGAAARLRHSAGIAFAEQRANKLRDYSGSRGVTNGNEMYRNAAPCQRYEGAAKGKSASGSSAAW